MISDESVENRNTKFSADLIAQDDLTNLFRVIPTMPSTEGWSWWPEGRFPCNNASRLSMYSIAFRSISTFGKRWLGLLLVRLFSTSKASLTCNASRIINRDHVNRMRSRCHVVLWHSESWAKEEELHEIGHAFVSREIFQSNFISRLIM